MNKFTGIVNFLISLITSFALTACTPEVVPDNTDVPSDLKVSITVSEINTAMVSILAEAKNAVSFELWIDQGTSAISANQTGAFNYTFESSGNHEITIRAYGTSGKFISEKRSVVIKLPVPLDKGYLSPLTYEGYQLVWQDEFEGTSLNTTDWVVEIGDGCPNCGWGNNELQYYKHQNATVSAGTLTIEAKKEVVFNRNYSSSRIKTQGKQSFKYGRADIRALLPEGQGIWPAIWMLGNDIGTNGWPKCGEIDIMEMIGGKGRENEVHGTVHWDQNGHQYTGGKKTLASGTYGDQYHVFSIIWDESKIRWLVNDATFYEKDISNEAMAEFHQEFFFILNVAVGGNWPGYPDNTTVFPQKMKVDYIRFFQKKN